jgi:alanyl-tRNA synthetase
MIGRSFAESAHRRYNPAMKRMYWTHPDVFEAEVEVTTVEPGKVTIDPILFHPDEGGQPADTGAIGEATVRDVQVVGGRIVHTLDRPLPNGRYLARVDRDRRLHTATQHTAQHILSGIASRQFGLQTVGVHIGLESCTVDFHDKIGWDVAEDLERRALDVVTADLPVETSFDAPGEQARSRLGPIDADVIRIVKIGDCDTSACCGAHVRSTGTIGTIRIFDMENRKAGTRVSFLAGRKALEQSQVETATLRDLRNLAACATTDLPANLQKTLERSKELAKEVNRLWSLRLTELAGAAQRVAIGPAAAGIYCGELPRDLVATLAGVIAEATGGAGIVISENQIAVSGKSLSASDLFKRIQARAGGKGGGSPRAASGRLDKSIAAQEVADILAGSSPS